MRRRIENSDQRTLHGGDIRALNVVFELGDLLLKFVEGNLLILCRGFQYQNVTNANTLHTDDEGDLSIV
jgi:hypothetical protein